VNQAINVTMALLLFAIFGLAWALWFSEQGCRELSRYFTARAMALPRKRQALLDARRAYHREMAEVLNLYPKSGPVEIRRVEKTV
jgi:hypothetical protein